MIVEHHSPDPNLQGDASTSDDVTPVLAAMLPWAVSALLHVGVILLALFAVWAVKVDPEDQETIIPLATLSRTPAVPLKTRPVRRRTAPKFRRSVTRSVGRARSSSSTASSNNQAELIGRLGAAASKASPFSLTVTRSDAGLNADMYGIGGNARKIVYIIDASGSLMDSFSYVINELQRSITQLGKRQRFAVIFFQGDRAPVQVPPAGLQPATAANKDKVIKWIDPSAGNIAPGGSTNPIKAIQLALRYRPQLIFLLSDNITGSDQYEVDQHRLLKAIKQANTHRTAIATIQFIYPDQFNTLELIAEQNGGEYKFVDARELGLQ